MLKAPTRGGGEGPRPPNTKKKVHNKSPGRLSSTPTIPRYGTRGAEARTKETQNHPKGTAQGEKPRPSTVQKEGGREERREKKKSRNAPSKKKRTLSRPGGTKAREIVNSKTYKSETFPGKKTLFYPGRGIKEKTFPRREGGNPFAKKRPVQPRGRKSFKPRKRGGAKGRPSRMSGGKKVFFQEKSHSKSK